MSNKFQSLGDAVAISRTNKKLDANYQRVRQALSQLVEDTATAPTLTDYQKRDLDAAVIALSYK